MKELFIKYELGECTKDEAAQVEAMLLKQPVPCSADILKNFRSIKYPNTIMDILIGDKEYENSLLSAYENGQCTNEEIEWVEQLLIKDHDDMPEIYQGYNQIFKKITVHDNEYLHDIPTDEQLNHPNYSPEYLQYIRALKTVQAPSEVQSFSAIDISEEQLLNKAMNDQLSEAEQLWFDALCDISDSNEIYNLYVDVMKNQRTTNENLMNLPNPANEFKESSGSVKEAPVKEGIIINLRNRIASIAAIAALFILGLFGIQSLNQSTQPATAEVIEITDPEEALEVTLAALSMVGKKMNSGNEEISKIKHIGRTNIFK